MCETLVNEMYFFFNTGELNRIISRLVNFYRWVWYGLWPVILVRNYIAIPIKFRFLFYDLADSVIIQRNKALKQDRPQCPAIDSKNLPC